MLNEQTILRTAQDMTYQSLGQDQDTVILLLDSGQLYTCNQTAAEFLSAVDGSRSFGQILDLLTNQFDVSRAQLRADLESLAEELIRERLLTLVQ